MSVRLGHPAEVPDESEIDFRRRATVAFSFLLARGFRQEAVSVSAVRFVNDSGIFVDVFHAPIERYTGFRVGLTAEPRDALSDGELRIIEKAPRSQSGFLQAESTDPLVPLARLLETHGERVLTGQPDVFSEGCDLRRQHTERYTRRP